jgi:hypothetical protein
MIVAADRRAVEKLARRLEVGLFVRTLPGKGKIFSLDECEEHLTPAEVDFLYAAGR